ncbi:unnamed protein product [Lactuca saligna]|uniref:RING-CH-type domain-containing protein n=1 Tax=Lactuca saligna TaxID=75948 RepID=A0AA36EMG2_LACSI|nr:unnamed protein product [Lactuca saligna]
MPTIGSLSGMEITGTGVEGSFAGVGWDRRRRGRRSNRRCRIPIEITNEASFNDYISSLSFTVGYSCGIHSYNHTPSIPISEEVDLESGELVFSENDGKQCRICHLKFEGGDDEEMGEDNGEALELGCDCKGDLATAHKKCALTWFLIKQDLNFMVSDSCVHVAKAWALRDSIICVIDLLLRLVRKCEICGSIVHNVGALVQNVDYEAIVQVGNNGEDEVQPPESLASVVDAENGSSTSMYGRRIVNVMLGCMTFGFVISWLFHFNVLH